MASKANKPMIIFALLGILLLIIAALLTPTSKAQEFISTALANVAFVLLTVVIVNFLWETLGGEPIGSAVDELRTSVKLLDDSHSSGIERILPISGTFGTHGDWMNRLKSAKESVDIMGYTLHVWTRGKDFEGEVVNLAQKGVKLRFLIMDKDNPNLGSLINNKIASISLDGTKRELGHMNNVFASIQNKLQQVLSPEVAKDIVSVRKVSKGLIVCQLCRIDSEMTVINYLYSDVASNNPLIVVRGKETTLFDVYEKEFNNLWELNKPTAA
jgi:hypothetical protein